MWPNVLPVASIGGRRLFKFFSETAPTALSQDGDGERERRQFFERLIEDDRNVLRHYVEGHTFGEIGTILGKSEGASHVQAHYAVQNLSCWRLSYWKGNCRRDHRRDGQHRLWWHLLDTS